MKTLILLTLPILAGIFMVSPFQHNGMQKIDPEKEYQFEDLPTGNDYQREWKEIQKLTEKGKTRTAVENLKKLFTRAKEEDNSLQRLKIVARLSAMRMAIEEDADSLALADLRNEYETQTGPGKQIAAAMLGDFLYAYYTANRWRILDRTELDAEVDQKAAPLDTWDALRFQNEIGRLFIEATQPYDELKKYRADDFALILERGENSSKYRPTLFDLLAQRAIGFFRSSESTFDNPAYRFELSLDQAFLPASEFAALELPQEDSLSSHLQMARLFQQLISLHYNKNATWPFVDLEIQRFRFMRDIVNGGEDDRKVRYEQALMTLHEARKDHPASSLVGYELAEFNSREGDRFDPYDAPEYRDRKKQALSYCRMVQEEWPDTEAAQAAVSLEAQIRHPSYSLTLESENLPKQPFRGLLTFRNLEKVKFRVLPADKLSMPDGNSEERVEYLMGLEPVESWELDLPAMDDFQQHRAEFAMPELDPGGYWLLAYHGEPSPVPEYFAFNQFQVSSFSYAIEDEADGGFTLFVTDRESGEPLHNVEVQAFAYNYRREKEVDLGIVGKTGKDGLLTTKNFQDRRIRFVLSHGKEKLSTQTYSNYNWDEDERENQRVFFFTDRKIYRPGQTIYFKAIFLSQKENEARVIDNKKLEIQFRDVNGQEISQVELRTNAYGSVTGSFTAPRTGLLGNMTLQTEFGSTRISIEEYKRPRFEVDFKPVEGSYALNEEVSVTGMAKTYSGVPVGEATVRYRVLRRARFPWWGFWSRWPMPSSPEQEIAGGETKTNSQGEFEVPFVLLPDAGIDPKRNPVFTYEVQADVTDINGETHSSQATLRAGYVAIELRMEEPAKVEVGDPLPVTMEVQNLSGEYQEVEGKLILYRLQTPERLLRPRRWARPDVHLIDSVEFVKKFPHDIYAAENEPENWPAEELYREAVLVDGLLKIDLEGWISEPGTYRLAFIVEDGDYTLRKEVPVTVTEEKGKYDGALTFLSGELNKTTAEPGESVTWNMRTDHKRAWVVYELFQGSSLLDRQVLDLRRNKTTEIAIPIKEEHRGNLRVRAYAQGLNSAHYLDEFIIVPWTNKELSLKWETFRSDLHPGEEETWRLTISGSKSEQVAAEMVATLYDASLDQFRANSYGMNLYHTYNWGAPSWDDGENFGTRSSSFLLRPGRPPIDRPNREYDIFDWPFRELIGYGIYNRRRYGAGRMDMLAAAPAPEAAMAKAGAPMEADGAQVLEESDYANNIQEDSQAQNGDGTPQEIEVRSNLNETAFFFPQLETNKAGEIVLNFTMPEALTRWKFLGLAHTKDLQVGTLGGEAVTSKEVMVTPNLPRFLREGDRLSLSAKINNTTDSLLMAEASIELLDALDMQPVDQAFDLQSAIQEIELPSEGGSAVSWEVSIPENVGAVVVRVKARAGNFADGEEHVLPILKNRMLVTESLPMWVKGGQTKTFKLDKLLASDTSSTLRHQSLTLEFTSNPAWLAVQALPYLMEYPYECTEQIFSRYYANALASHIANSNPKIKRIFEQWRSSGQSEGALLSSLEKNQDLKAVLLEETPWLLEAQNESERKRRIALLFDLNRMADELARSEQQLGQRQNASGAFSWFPGMRDNRYITQMMVTGFGHLQKLGVNPQDPEMLGMMEYAVPWLDDQIARDYRELRRRKLDLEEDHLGYTQIQYLYARSFFKDIPLAEGTDKAFQYYFGQAKKYWLEKSYYMQGMIALALHRYDEETIAGEVVVSLDENAVKTPDRGMYWKSNFGPYSWFWYQAPVETQSLLIETFEEVAGDRDAVEEMQVWLLRNKQTNDWRSTRATADAVYALLLGGRDLLASEELVSITMGGVKIDPRQSESGVEAGTGYFQTQRDRSEIEPKMGEVTVTKNESGIAWGALYWQYFEQLDKITSAASPLSIEKKLFRKSYTKAGPRLEAIDNTNNRLEIGDRVTARIILRTDRPMEYVHLKDQRASAFEPLNVLSSYKYQAGLGYYESTRDAATHFFMDYLPAGTHVFEYDLFVTQKGDFSNGIATLQCMYAPEFSSHSEGIRVVVE